jgi:hypothetical protein
MWKRKEFGEDDVIMGLMRRDMKEALAFDLNSKMYSHASFKDDVNGDFGLREMKLYCCCCCCFGRARERGEE